MTTASAAPPLPRPRGPLSAAVVSRLREGTGRLPSDGAIRRADPYGADPQTALYVLYELHYRGFDGVDDDLEWEPELLAVRRPLEETFLAALRAGAPATGLRDTLTALLAEPAADTGTDVSRYLHHRGGLDHLREYAALRSLYHLKEADPHAWALPRLCGRAKAGLAAIEFDEFGAGRAEDIHARLFADLMTDLGLETGYGHYVDLAPTEALTTVNLMSLLGLHRSLRGALVGHFATVEITSPPAARRLTEAMHRTGAGPAAERFYAEHVLADAVHEQVVRHEVIGGLLQEEPALEPDVAFGIHATGQVEDRLARHLLTAWQAGSSALREALPPAA
ncbi:iron-containing redox enzyme family protein [Streptomyces sp. NPDC014733]|uniref:iron-containing redox enzyme family protein n=1 Tax=Streptomyces sp. NPDC014733 TaxID=3364885 RepID=UPI0036FCF4FE